jgi:thioredoxin-like negative regulator of GroEL
MVQYSTLYSNEVDKDLLKKEDVYNPHEVNARLILSRFYIGKSNYDEAQKLLDEVLQVYIKNQKALFLLKDIKKLKQIESLVKSGKLSQSSKLSTYFDKLVSQKHYKYATLLYEVLNRNNIKLSSDVVENTVDSYIHTHEFKKAQRVLENSTLSLQDKDFLEAKIYAKKGQNLQSENSYKSALKLGDREDIVLGLYELYIKQNRIKDAKELIKSYETKGSKSTIFSALQKEDKRTGGMMSFAIIFMSLIVFLAGLLFIYLALPFEHRKAQEKS